MIKDKKLIQELDRKHIYPRDPRRDEFIRKYAEKNHLYYSAIYGSECSLLISHQIIREDKQDQNNPVKKLTKKRQNRY